jgi:hypothetical protein
MDIIMNNSKDFAEDRDTNEKIPDVMPIENDPILTIEQAKKYYIFMGCSHFHIDREHPIRRDEYRALHISSELESQWRNEEFIRRVQAFPYSDQSKFAINYFWLKEILAFGCEQQLEDMVTILSRIYEMVPATDIHMILSYIIGNNGTKSHGGLIEHACSIQRFDLVDKFVDYSMLLLERAEENNIEISFIRGYFVDVIVHFNLKINQKTIDMLMKKDREANINYYSKGALEGNVYSMRILA